MVAHQPPLLAQRQHVQVRHGEILSVVGNENRPSLAGEDPWPDARRAGRLRKTLRR